MLKAAVRLALATVVFGFVVMVTPQPGYAGPGCVDSLYNEWTNDVCNHTSGSSCTSCTYYCHNENDFPGEGWYAHWNMCDFH